MESLAREFKYSRNTAIVVGFLFIILGSLLSRAQGLYDHFEQS